jgi:hypothetical protein
VYSLVVKTLYTVCVDDYFPELTQYTIPNLERFAQRIGAKFHVISDRKYPEFPPTYEKLQIHTLGKDNDWNILVDADAMFSPQMFDPTSVVAPNYIGYHMEFDASLLFEPDEYFFRDGRKKGIATTFMVVPRACHDIWTPLEFSADVAKTKTKRWFIVDEYCVSRNLARFGLKQTGILEGDSSHLYKHFDLTTESPSKELVVELAKKFAKDWK